MAVNWESVSKSIDDNLAAANQFLETAAEKSGPQQRIMLMSAQQRIEDVFSLIRLRDSLEE